MAQFGTNSAGTKDWVEANKDLKTWAYEPAALAEAIETSRRYAVLRDQRSLSLQLEPESEGHTHAVERARSYTRPRVGLTKLREK